MFKRLFISPAQPFARRDALLPKQGRSERDAEAYGCWYVEALSDARTKLEGCFNIR
jgi:hypothetical protein